MNSAMKVSEISLVLKDRYSGYAFLARVYREEVSIAFLRELAGNRHSTRVDDTASEGNSRLQKFAESLREADLEEVRTDLVAEYTALFVGAGPSPVFPYESVYTSPEKLLMQQARDQVLKQYREEGLDRAFEYKEPEDHIAVEFEFMSYLCRKTLEAVEKGDHQTALVCLLRQKRFLEQHLTIWIPVFAADVEQKAKSEFYRAIARITKEYLGLEQDTVGALIGEVE